VTHPGLQHEQRLREAAQRVASANAKLYDARRVRNEARRKAEVASLEYDTAYAAAHTARCVLNMIAGAEAMNDYGLPLVDDAVPATVMEAFPEIAAQMKRERPAVDMPTTIQMAVQGEGR
jgi:hypothetical protein